MSTVIKAEIDEPTKKKAEQVLARLRISPEHALAMFYAFIAAEEALPFEIPNAETRAAIEAARRGEVKEFSGSKLLMEDLWADAED